MHNSTPPQTFTACNKDNCTSVHYIIPAVVKLEPIQTYKFILVQDWCAPMSRQHKKYDFRTEFL